MNDQTCKPATAKEIFLRLDRCTTQEERDFLLNDACQNDTALRRQVEALVAAQAQSRPNLLDRMDGMLCPTEMLGSTHSDSPLDFDITTPPQIGPYTIREQIGEGGMGTVYVAEQKEPVRRKVALKIIRAGMAGKEIVARFEAERQALAMMDHPNIARVIDGGTTPAGQPFFAMELVQGVPITQYADANRMSIPERLAMFMKVCLAVQHAHRKGIIHRDLKPSNVLVARIDDQAVPKVIDFGLAKAISQPLTDATLYTGFSRMMGTPMYMSPEQAEMGVIDVDTRCDVYALGVMLYELLTGDPPFSRETFKSASFDEVRRIIREVEPKRPSFAISTLVAERQTTIADRRHIDSRKLRDSLHGELDWIVMKALEKDRSRRYESASDFAADIERYLRNERVEACPPSTAYTLRKFANRNRGLVTAAAVVALLILIAAGLLWNERSRTLTALDGETSQRHVAERNLVLANSQKAVAEANLQTAVDAVDQMLSRVGSSSLRDVPQMERVRLELLQDACLSYGKLIERDPGVPRIRFQQAKTQIDLAQLLMTGWHSDGERREALEPCRAAVETLKALCSEFPNVSSYKEWLGISWLTQAKMGRNQIRGISHEASIACCRNAIAVHESLRSAHPDNRTHQIHLAECCIELAHQLLESNRPTESAIQARHAIDSLGYEDSDAYFVLGCSERAVGRLPESEVSFSTAVRVLRDELRQFPPNTEEKKRLGWTLCQHGRVLTKLNRYDEAERCLREAIEVLARVEADYSNRYWGWFTRESVNSLADMCHASGNEMAMERLATALHPETSLEFFVRGKVRQALGRRDLALRDFDCAIELRPDLVEALRARGSLHLGSGNYDAALADYSRSIDVAPDYPYDYRSRALCHYHLGHYTDALADIAKSLELLPKGHLTFWEIHPALAAACPDRNFQLGLLNLADRELESDEGSAAAFSARGLLLSALGDNKRSLADFDKALELEPSNASLCNKIAWHFATCFDADPEVSKRAVVLAEMAASLNPGSTTWNTLGVTRYRVEDVEGAIEALEKAEELSPGQFSAHNGLFLAMAHAKLGQKVVAQQWYEKAVAWINARGADDELQRFRSEADQLLESLDMFPPPSGERPINQTGGEDTRAGQPPTQPERSIDPALDNAGADPS